MPSSFHAGSTGGYTVVKTLTLSLDTSAYANGDLLADTQVIDNALRLTGGTGRIRSIAVLDEDDQTPYTFTVFVLDANVSLGTENSAISVTDANARNLIAAVDFATTDCRDMINSRFYYKSGLDIPITAISATDDIAIALAVITGTPTHTASGIRVRIGIEQD